MTWPGDGSSSAPVAPASRSTRCATWATARSGKQGYALARAAAERGAEVTLVSSSSLPAPDGVTVVPVETALSCRPR